MRKDRKRWTAVLTFLLLGAVWLGGCGKGGEKEEGQTKATKAEEKGDFVYVPEGQTLNADGLQLMIAAGNGDQICFIAQTGGGGTQDTDTYLCRVKIGETEITKNLLESGDSTNLSVTAMCMKPDGNLYLLVNRLPAVDPESGQTEAEAAQGNAAAPSPELWTVDAEGKVLSSVSLAGASDQGTDALAGPGFVMSIEYMETDASGNLYTADYEKLTVYSPEGEKLFELPLNGIGAMTQTGDGTVVLSTMGENGMQIKPVDVAGKKLGEAYPNLSFGYSTLQLAKGAQGENTLLISSENRVCSYDTASGTSTELFNWLDMNVNSDMLRLFCRMPDGSIAALTSEGQEEGQQFLQLSVLTRMKASEAPQKKTLVLGTMQVYGELKTLITDFNKTSTDYRIEVKEYAQAGQSDSYEEGMTRMKADIISGNCPDIVDLGVGSGKQYMARGILEDLNPYLEKDPEINKEDYLENVMNAYQVDGKLYGLFPSFYIDTLVAAASDMEGKTSWTLDEMIDYANKRPEGSRLFQFESADNILMYIVRMNQSRYLDWKTGECRFTDEDFIRLLEFSAQFPPQDEVRFDHGDESMTELLRAKKVLLLDTNIGDVQDYQQFTMMYGEPVTFIGYPTEDGQGSEILAGTPVLGMSSKSANKEGVWQFLRSYMTREYQEALHQDPNMRPGFPIMKSALEAFFEAAMTPEYYEDENGNSVEKPKNLTGFSLYGDVGDIYAATQEDIDAVRALVESVDSHEEYDMQMAAIILGEAAPFFKGQKSAQEVADVIQSKMQTYVNENR